jgi:hypothetical protein
MGYKAVLILFFCLSFQYASAEKLTFQSQESLLEKRIEKRGPGTPHSQIQRSIPPAQPSYLKVNTPVKIKDASLQVLAGRKMRYSSISINAREVIPATADDTWYYEYVLSSAKDAKLRISCFTQIYRRFPS